MKKLSRLALLLALAASSSSTFATDPRPAIITVSVQVVPATGGQPLYVGKAVAADGRSVPLSQTQELGYLASVTCHPDGAIEMTPGKVTQGVSMVITPSVGANGRISVDVVASMAQLLAMEESGSACGPVHRPRLKMVAFRQAVSLRDGQEISVPFGSSEPESAGAEAAKPSHVIKIVAKRG